MLYTAGNVPSSLTYTQYLSTEVGIGYRIQYPYDLSGVKYQTKSDLLTRQRQWNTYEQVENSNYNLYQSFLSGNFSKSWYQFRANNEASDYRVGQQLHTVRYSNLPATYFQSISLAPLPICTNGTAPAFYSQAPKQTNPTMTEGEKTENNADLAIYTQVSSYNVLHSTFTYQFTSNEEQLAYHRAEFRLYAAAERAAGLSTLAGAKVAPAAEVTPVTTGTASPADVAMYARLQARAAATVAALGK